MAHPTKIATCCYCGTRAALVLDRGRHELACSACGAPLHEMKSLPVARRGTGPARLRQDGARAAPPPADVLRPRGDQVPKPRRAAPPRRRKGLFARLIEEAVDAIEDIFD